MAIHPPHLPVTGESAPILAELQIAVLYQLNRLHADTGEPIEVKRTEEGRIQVSGAIASDSLRAQITSELRTLPNHQLLDLKLFSPQELRMHASRSRLTPATRLYEVNQGTSAADNILRNHFQSQGPFRRTAECRRGYVLSRRAGACPTCSAARLRSRSSRPGALCHRTGIGHRLVAAAMDGDAASACVRPPGTTAGYPRSTGPDCSAATTPDTTGTSGPIENPLQFSHAAGQLLQQVQELDRHVSSAFASGTSAEGQASQEDLIAGIIKVIPLQASTEIKTFAMELSSSATHSAAQKNPDELR